MTEWMVGDIIIFFVFQEAIASHRGLKTSTIVGHLCEAIKVGLPVDVESLGVASHIKKLITTTIRGDKIKSGNNENNCQRIFL